jgi:hypothetical protein
MLRMRMFPLRAGGEDGADGSVPLLAVPVVNREDEFDRMDSKESVSDAFFMRSFFHIQTFALWTCLFNAALFVVAIIATGVYESGSVTERFALRTPVTKTAVIWAPHSNASVMPQRVAGAQCDLFDSRGFFGPKEYMQFVVFEYDTLPARYPLTFILFVGALFQFVSRFSVTLYMEPFMVGNSHITSFLERSISFPLFVLVLAAKSGISDLMLLLGLVFSAWSAMLFSFFAEVLFQGDGGFLAIGPGLARHLRSGDTVRRDGGIWVWRDGNFHYHALGMFFALANFAFVCVGLLHNFYLESECFAGPLASPTAVLPVKALIYCTLALYGLILLGQVFTAYMKPKPSTIQRDREFLIADWKKANVYVDARDVESVTDPKKTGVMAEQRRRLMEGLNLRVRCALLSEFFNGLLDSMIKVLVISCFFVFFLD